AAKRQHGPVLAQDLAFEGADAILPRVIDKASHQSGAKPDALEVASYKNAEFGAGVVRVGGIADDAGECAFRLRERDEGDVPVVVQLRQADDHLRRKLSRRDQEAPPHVLGRDALQELRIELGIDRADWPHAKRSALAL